VITGSAIGAATFTLSAEGQPRRDTDDPSDPVPDLPTQMELGRSKADQPTSRNSQAADVDRPVCRTSKRANQGQPSWYLQNNVIELTSDWLRMGGEGAGCDDTHIKKSKVK